MMSVSGCRIKGINNKQKHYLSTMSNVGYGLEVTVRVVQHSEMMEEAKNEIAKQQL